MGYISEVHLWNILNKYFETFDLQSLKTLKWIERKMFQNQKVDSDGS